MTNSKLNQKRALVWRIVLTILLLCIAVYILVAHRRVVTASFETARYANAVWFGCCLLLMAGTFCVAAMSYGVLAMHRLRYAETLLVEVAGAFVNRLLPAGVGGLGLNGAYLYKHRHTPAEATVVVSVNNLLGMTAHLLLLVAVLFLRPSVIRAILSRHDLSVPWRWIATTCTVLVVVCLLPGVRPRITNFTVHLLQSLRRIRPIKIVRGTLLALLLTVLYTGMLYSAGKSVGITLGLLPVFMVFSFGMLVGTATPTPGGLVGAEAGLFGGFVAYGVPTDQAGATVLLFRLVSYWLPLLPGVVALFKARSRGLL
jgi:uncharacterized membrane protein YbhN (UPF0104 family)